MVAASACPPSQAVRLGELSSASAASRPSRIEVAIGLFVVALAAWLEPSAISRGLLAALGATVLIWPAAKSRGAERLRTRLIVLVALASLTLSVSGRLPEFVTSWKVRVWNVYHYYLGAKYFEELGYVGLYDATLRADSEGEGYWREIRRVRNLETYEVEDRNRSADRFDPSEVFEPARWQEFRRDVEGLAHHRSPPRWTGIFVDRGYNGTPLWTVVGSTLTRFAPADRPVALKILCSLDLALLIATFWLLWRTFGTRAAALVLLLLTSSPVNIGRFVGGFLQYDWFCAVTASACLYRRRRPAAAAGALAYATLTRIFPVLFFATGVIPLVRSWWRTGRPPRRQLRFAGAFAAWCVVGLLVSLANGRGVDGWREFATGIKLHKESHLYGERRVGLQFLFTYELGSLDFNDSEAARVPIYQRQKGLFAASAAGLLVYTLVVAWRQRSWNARLLGLVPTFALLVTSRYYWSYLALLPLTGGPRGPPAVRARWLGGAQLLLFAAFYAVDFRDGDPYATYIVFSALLLVYLMFALSALAPRLSR